ncbi:MAG: SDR family NAD(P)-dependent oxidoreductase, partial [Acetobacteraceae bacterium]|nr:SDR family NAD(P)-dependent oxidoreductase [Acetobacteraceae bacterium]
MVITGASSGIGRCTASAFGRAGWRVGLLARGQAGLDSIREELAAAGVAAASVVVDVVEAEALEAAAAAIEAELGPIDV